MIEEFREKFGEHDVLCGVSNDSRGCDCDIPDFEAFLLEWSEKLLAKGRAEWEESIDLMLAILHSHIHITPELDELIGNIRKNINSKK